MVKGHASKLALVSTMSQLIKCVKEWVFAVTDILPTLTIASACQSMNFLMNQTMKSAQEWVNAVMDTFPTLKNANAGQSMSHPMNQKMRSAQAWVSAVNTKFPISHTVCACQSTGMMNQIFIMIKCHTLFALTWEHVVMDSIPTLTGVSASALAI